jgi:hypothetical protein
MRSTGTGLCPARSPALAYMRRLASPGGHLAAAAQAESYTIRSAARGQRTHGIAVAWVCTADGAGQSRRARRSPPVCRAW